MLLTERKWISKCNDRNERETGKDDFVTDGNDAVENGFNLGDKVVLAASLA